MQSLMWMTRAPWVNLDNKRSFSLRKMFPKKILRYKKILILKLEVPNLSHVFVGTWYCSQFFWNIYLFTYLFLYYYCLIKKVITGRKASNTLPSIQVPDVAARYKQSRSLVPLAHDIENRYGPKHIATPWQCEHKETV